MVDKQELDHPGVIGFPPLIYSLPLLLGIVASSLFGSSIINSPINFVVGSPLLILGIGLATWGNKVMLKAGTNVHPSHPTLSIVKDAPFSFTRNPLYLALALIYLGLAFLFNSLWALILLLPVLVVITWGVILREEAYLERKFGQEYLEYKSSVRRWI